MDSDTDADTSAATGCTDNELGLMSLIETAKASGLEPYAYLQQVLQRIGAADTLDNLEALLPWNLK